MQPYGQTLNVGDTVFGPWFARQADSAYIYFEVINAGTAEGDEGEGEGDPGSLAVSVYHKDEEDTSETGTAATVSPLSQGGAGRTFAQVSGLKDLVRLRYECSDAWVLWRLLGIVWYDTAAAS